MELQKSQGGNTVWYLYFPSCSILKISNKVSEPKTTFAKEGSKIYQGRTYSTYTRIDNFRCWCLCDLFPSICCTKICNIMERNFLRICKTSGTHTSIINHDESTSSNDHFACCLSNISSVVGFPLLLTMLSFQTMVSGAYTILFCYFSWCLIVTGR